MLKNIVMAALAGMLFAPLTGTACAADEEISAAEYGGLAALRDIIPADQFRKDVLPLLREALKDGKMTRSELEAFSAKLPDLGRQTLASLEKERPQDRLVRAWDETLEDVSKGAANFGEALSREMGNAMRDLEDSLKGMTAKPEDKGEVTL